MSISRKELIELIGVTAVVGSLIFVGVQLSFDRQVALGDQYQRRAEIALAHQRSYLESESYMDLRIASWEAGNRPIWWNASIEDSAPDYYDARRFVTRLILLTMQLIEFDYLHYQYQKGLIEGDYWQGSRRNLSALLTGNLAQALFLNQGRRSEFTQLLAEIVAEINEG